ncbi:MAG: hypothetical protein US30_C0004G0001 [Candidatus Moranbacteria bacterium GW2011_GWF2_36_839]|nr:MAG: hypothetical protein US27_C0002G0004 [Candidatus Moranbacteria bacterium GW2011_GWF1_36_78]KKQ17257.1 MAG: hypothetical protein US30_C0004G0001 [Candidatus Moranbacteria bacterium GW2011_GWF2_36_839]HAT73900.1 hypothetical protein [Candidatus Moranbacteria bacterium]HBY10957.1 hypothetical protein [Candidatus Moranbacteria bacterium]
MELENTERKKYIIISVYLTFFILIILGLYFAFKPEETCTDGRQNQNERGVDCGGVCQKECNVIVAKDLTIGKIGVVFSGLSDKYDFYAKVTNPNAVFGDKNFAYEINLKDEVGSIIATKKGFSFILPGEEKYIVETNIDAPSVPFSQEFKILSSNWIRFEDYYERPDIQIINKNYSEISGGTGFANAQGLLRNRSPYDFDSIKIQIILKDSTDNILALNSTQMGTVKAGEDRDFKTFWPSSFPGTVSTMEAQAEVNIFNSEAFIKRTY